MESDVTNVRTQGKLIICQDAQSRYHRQRLIFFKGRLTNPLVALLCRGFYFSLEHFIYFRNSKLFTQLPIHVWPKFPYKRGEGNFVMGA